MRRCAVFGIICTILLAVAAPSGAAFASEPSLVLAEEAVVPAVAETMPVPVEPAEPSVAPVVPPPASLPAPAAEQPGSTAELPPPPATPLSPPVVHTPSSAPVVSAPVTEPPVIIVSMNVALERAEIALFNQTNRPVDATKLRLLVTGGEQECEVGVEADGWLPGRSFLTVQLPSLSSCGLANISRVELFSGQTRLQLADGLTAAGWLHHKTIVTRCALKVALPTTLEQTGSAADFVACGAPLAYTPSELYQLPTAEETKDLKIVELMSDSLSCAPDRNQPGCYDFIKVKNTGQGAINLANYRLRSGASTTASSSTNTFHWQQPTLHPLRDEYILQPGAVLTISLRDGGEPLSLTSGDGNVWIEDYYGLATYSSVAYHDMDLAAAEGLSWAYNAALDVWQFGEPSPGGENVLYVPVDQPGRGAAGASLRPCRDDQYRSEETNRCRSVATASALTPCREGQYRSEETNRCRSIASAAASVLKPCADDQYRSPETNRCRKIASADELADCGEGRERNPTTNRCRNVAAAQPAKVEFPVEKVADAPSAFVGWWVLGAIALAAGGYATWEWRREIASGVKKVAGLFGKK